MVVGTPTPQFSIHVDNRSVVLSCRNESDHVPSKIRKMNWTKIISIVTLLLKCALRPHVTMNSICSVSRAKQISLICQKKREIITTMNLRDLFLTTDVASDRDFGHLVYICDCLTMDHFDLILVQSETTFGGKSAAKYLTFITDSHCV